MLNEEIVGGKRVAPLIEMKEKSERPHDKADILYLKKILEDWQHEAKRIRDKLKRGEI